MIERRWPLAAPAAARRDELRHLGLLLDRGVAAARRIASVLEKSHAVEAGLGFNVILVEVTIALAIIALPAVALSTF